MNVKITGRHLDGARFLNVVFPFYVNRSSFQFAVFENCILETVFIECDFYSTVFEKVYFGGGLFSNNTRLDLSEFKNSNLHGTSFLESSLVKAKIMNDCDIEKIKFYNCNLSGIDIGETCLLYDVYRKK